MRVLLDTDVVMDVITERQPFDVEASEILDRCERGEFEGFITGITPVNVFYVARKAKSVTNLKQKLSDLLQVVNVCLITHANLTDALTSSFTDYEDAVQHACAVENGLDAIVTRNLTDYKNATLPVLSPAEFLKQLKNP